MAPQSGTAGSVIVFTAGSETVVGGISEWTLTQNQDVVDVTPLGTGERRYIPITRSATGSFVGYFDASDAGQSAIQTNHLAGSSVHLLLYESATGYAEFVRANVTGESPTITVDGRVDISYDFQLTDTIETSTNISRRLLESGDVRLMEDGSFKRLESYITWGS